jgi:FkbM family methyltransferase
MKTELRHAAASMMRPLVFPGRFKVYKTVSSVLGDEPLPFEVRIRCGCRLLVNSPIWQQLFYLGDYERDVRIFLEREVDSKSIVFDVGACIGVHAMPLATKAKEVYAFDALRGNFEVLSQNLLNNGMKNVTPVYAAVSDSAGTIRIPVPDFAGGNYSLASDGKQSIEIEAVTIDSFCSKRKIEKIDVMKMDIEGSETRALRGARNMFLARAIRKTVIEFNPYWLRKMGSDPNELYDLFEEYGLAVYELTRFGRTRRISRSQCMAKTAHPGSYFNLVLTAA